MSDGAKNGGEGQPQEVQTPEPSAAEQNLSPQDQQSLRTAREGLPPVDPNAPRKSDTQRPDNIPEKFWDAEKGEVRLDALASSYSELETKLSGGAEEPREEGPDGEGGEDDNVEVKNGKISKKSPEGSEEGGEDNPVSTLISTAATEFGENGEFTEETAKSLSEAGIPEEVQQIYLKGLEAQQQQQTAAVHGYVGGEDNYNAMARWAGQNLSDGELEAFNSSLGNPGMAENAVRGLYARYRSAKPSEGKQVKPTNGTADGGDTFKTREDMTAAMADPRYKTDPAYQREVVAKLDRTRKAGQSFNR